MDADVDHANLKRRRVSARFKRDAVESASQHVATWAQLARELRLRDTC